MKNTWRLIYLSIPLTVAVFAGILAHNAAKGPELCEGVGRAPEVSRYAAEAEAGTEETAEYKMVSYVEGEGPAPVWWDPEEPMAAEWIDSQFDDQSDCQHDTVDYNARRDIGCPSWNVDSAVTGWDGHTAEPWELDLLARVFYLEFWGVSDPCAEAGCDAILNLWDTGRYGRTLFDALSYYDPEYGYTYRVYPRVWETNYDPDGLAWCKEFCTERFLHGPEWSAVYFQLGGYHDPEWVPPLYEMDGVFFSGAAYGGQ